MCINVSKLTFFIRVYYANFGTYYIIKKYTFNQITLIFQPLLKK
jgi:hypothetical protein